MIVDVALVAALGKERVALGKMLLSLSETPPYIYQGARAPYEIFSLPNGLKIALAPHLTMGQLAASLGTALMLYDLHPSFIILGGITGCVRSQEDGFVFGDVIVSDRIVDYELEKLREDGKEIRPRDFPTSQSLKPHLSAALPSWRPDPAALPPPPHQQSRLPRAVSGGVLSGNQVVASLSERNKLREIGATVIGIEMESAGVAAMLAHMRRPDRFLMVKSITDFADGNKTDEWHEYASAASASCIGYLLENTFPAFLQSYPPSANESRELFQHRTEWALTSFLESQSLDIAGFRSVAADMLKNTLEEILDLMAVAQSAASYEGTVGAGDHYLLRARPLFRHATRIIATSLDTVSTFWLAPKNRRKVREFISTHAENGDPNNVMRLFVFSDPKSAHDHALRLDFHAEYFQNTFVCSRDQYVEFLEIVAPDSIQKYLERDFAIIECDTSEGSRTFFADLDDDSLNLNEALYDHPDAEVNIAEALALFEELAELGAGELSDTRQILKWQVNHWRSKEWADHLEAMFAERTADVFHMVTFDISQREYDDLRTLLAGIKYKILDGTNRSAAALAERHQIRDVRLMKRIDQRHRLVDPVSKGHIHYSDDSRMQYMLLMQLGQQDTLNNFMVDREHLRMRLELFSRLGGNVSEVMRGLEVETPEALEATSNPKLLYEVLEALAAQRMHRYDYTDDELISEMVHKKPPRL